MLFRNRVAVITGSTGEGMGRSIALTFAKEGARVVLNYGTGHPNNMSAADKVLEEIRALGGYAIKADTREEDEVKAMINGAITLYGQIDFLICNSGGAWEPRDLTEIDQESWRSVIKAELDGLFYSIKLVLPHMRRARFGRIVAIGMAGAERQTGPPYDYHVGKGARNLLMRAIAGDELANGITCNVVAPGHIKHVTLKQAVESAKLGGIWKRRTAPLPQDVAEIVRFLCSEQADWVTGSVIEVGGHSPGA
jgi:NAD(P)-dependent dehydrogenase (short-subunit alcohol dehydrogenase family)